MYTETHDLDGCTMLEHWLDVPLDYMGIQSILTENHTPANFPQHIAFFAREYVRAGMEHAPRLAFFQGGPGSAGPRMAPIGSWLDVALKYFRVVLIDERGTGNSYPLDATLVTEVGNAQAQAAFLSCFRQDSIVRDAEILRRELQGDQPWAVLGQSFGGFVVTSYLSQRPEGLSAAYITAGLPSLDKPADAVYSLTYPATARRNQEFFARYPKDEETAWFISTHLADVEEFLPSGERLTPARFRQLGILLGFSYGPDALHFILENPVWVHNAQRRLRPQFLARVDEQLSYARNPLYGVLQEAIYAQRSTGATGWSAQRLRSTFPEFALPPLAAGGSGELDLRRQGQGFRFTGEHVYPWQIAQDPALAPMSDAAEVLAYSSSWPELYSRQALEQNDVPTAAWIYTQDMFVPFDLSMETVQHIKGAVPLISETYHHDALRTSSPDVMEGLLKAVPAPAL